MHTHKSIYIYIVDIVQNMAKQKCMIKKENQKRRVIERLCHQRCADISSAGAGVMSNRSKESEVRKTESKLSLTHLNAALTSEISIPAKQLLILTRCPVEVVPGLELPDQLYTSINGSMWTESPRSQKYPNIPIMDAYATSYNCPANCVLALNQT